MSIFATLIKNIRKDNNGAYENLTDRFMNIELLIEPTQNTALILPNGKQFFINTIIQDLKNRRLILYEFHDICHEEFQNDNFYLNFLEKLDNEGWLRNMPKAIFPRV